MSVSTERERDQKGTVSIDKDAEKGKMCVEAFPSAHILRFEHISLFLSYQHPLSTFTMDTDVHR